jgi:polyisoprenoid-binding protein YceI
MYMMKYKKTAFLLLLFIIICLKSVGQSFDLNKENSSVKISGTSNLHDWEMYLNDFDCSVTFKSDKSVLKEISKVSFSCKSKDIKSNNSIMDKKTYAALNAETYPEIKFNSLTMNGIKTVNSKFSGILRGNLLIAGISNAVAVPFTGFVINTAGKNEISVSGSVELQMSDFKISPPTAIMGTLKTGNIVILSFSLHYLQESVN